MKEGRKKTETRLSYGACKGNLLNGDLYKNGTYEFLIELRSTYPFFEGIFWFFTKTEGKKQRRKTAKNVDSGNDGEEKKKNEMLKRNSGSKIEKYNAYG